MAESNEGTFKIAAVQMAPVFLNLEATVEKACALIVEAGREGARLVVFPEGFIPTYPVWVWAASASDEAMLHDLYAELVANAVEIPGPATQRLGQAARRAKVNIAIGVNERNMEASGGTLYNTLLYIDDQGNVVGKHRKLVPTSWERLVWGPGDGSTLNVFDFPFGRVGGLICWENYMPLARYTLFAWGVQIHLAVTWDRGGAWLSTLRHIAREGGVFVIGNSIAMRTEDIPNRYEFKSKLKEDAEGWINIGDSAIVNPQGKFIAGPLRKTQEILYAEIDPRQTRGTKWMFDVAGHYARPDVFELTVHTEARPMIRLARGETEPRGEA